jgi:prefoldin subunit 5
MNGRRRPEWGRWFFVNSSRAVVRFMCIAVALMLGLVTVLSVGPGVRSESIEVSTDMPPLPMERLAAGVVLGDDGRIYIFGGYRYNYTSDWTASTLMIYNVSTGVTSYGTSMPNGVAWPSCAKLDDGRIVVIGGYDSSVQNGTKAVRIYNPRSNTWTTNTSAPENISRASTALGLNGKVYVFGPVNSQNSTLVYDVVNDTWSYGSDLSWARSRYDSCAVTYNETAIYVIGGFHFEKIWVWPGFWMYNFYDTNYVDIYNPLTDTWSVGPSLNKNKYGGGAALARNGCMYYFGGQTLYLPVYDEIEKLDVSSSGATWQTSIYTLSQEKVYFGTVVDDLGRMFLVGGVDYPTYAGIADVEMILTAEVSEVNEIVITAPSDGAEVNGTVEISVEVKNQHLASVVVVDAYLDGELLESQLGGGATDWAFEWNATGLALNSTHDVLIRAFFSDGTVSEDNASYVIAPVPTESSVDERLLQIEENISAVLDAISDLASDVDSLGDSISSLSENISDLETELQSVKDDLASLEGEILSVLLALDDIQTQIDALGNSIADLRSSTEADLSQLTTDLGALAVSLDAVTVLVEQLQTSVDELAQQPGTDLSEVMDELESLMDAVEGLNRTLDEVTASVDETEESAGDASFYALVAIALAALVLVVLAVGVIVMRRKPEG